MMNYGVIMFADVKKTEIILRTFLYSVISEIFYCLFGLYWLIIMII